MTPTPEVQERLRRYLLGQLADDAREEVERNLMAGDELFQELLIAEDEIVDEYLNGKLDDAERLCFEQHFLATPERHEKLRFGRTFNRYVSSHRVDPPLPQPAWTQLLFSTPVRIGVAAIVLVAIGVGVWRIFFYQSEVDKGLLALNAAYREQRPLESRISRLGYAPFSQVRGKDERVDTLARNRAEAILIVAATDKADAAARHALGEVYLAKKQFDDAIKEFEEALKGDPSNARIYSDLGAAWLEKGKIAKTVDDFARSLGYLNKALELNGNALEALFNRALCRQYLILWDEARNDWLEYLKRDADSQWAVEARQNLKLLEERLKEISQSKEQIFQSFLTHFEARNDNAAWRVISSYHDRAGNIVAERLLDMYLEAAAKSDLLTSREQLGRLSYLADQEAQKADERYFSDIVRFYQATTSKQQASIVRARALLKSAHQGWGQSKVEESLSLFVQAKELFDQAGVTSEAALTEYWISFCYHRQELEAQSLSLLQSLLTMCERKSYRWLQVRVLYLIAAIQFDLNEHSKAIDFAGRSLATAEKTNDVVGTLNALISLTEYHRYLGNYEKSLAYMEQSLPLASSISMDPVQGTRVYGFQAQALAYAGFYSAAADYQSQALRLALATGNVSLITYNYVFLATLNGELGKFEAAIQNAQHAYDTAAAHSNEAADRDLMGYASLQMGNFYRRQKNFSAALAQYDRSLKFSEELNQPIDLYQAHKGKLYCFIATGDDAQAKTEITHALGLVEQYRDKIFEENNRQSFFQAEQSLYDLAIDFEFSKRNDAQEALRLSEMSRGRSLLDLIHADARVWKVGTDLDLVSSRVVSPLTPDEIRLQMPANTQILQYSVLKEKLIMWVISKEKISPVTQEIGAEKLAEHVRAFLKITSSPSSDAAAIKGLGRQLFDLVIAPAQPSLDPHKVTCIVPDKSLNFLPFAALTSPSGRYLFEDYALLFSPASSVFIASSNSAGTKENIKSEKLLSVGNPDFDRTTFPSFADLPSAGKEAAEISNYYESPRVLIGGDATVSNVKNGMVSADVIHLATHSSLNERAPLRSEFVLAKGSGDSDSESGLPAFEIYQLKLQRPRLVILSACQTGAEHYYDGEGMISLVRPFLVSRIPLVIASSWPVDSEATRQLMLRFHEHRKVGKLSTLKAFQRSQKEMLTVSDGRYSAPYYWAAFTTIGGYARF